MGHPVSHTIFLSPVTHAEINQVMVGLKNGAAGCGEITAVTCVTAYYWTTYVYLQFIIESGHISYWD